MAITNINSFFDFTAAIVATSASLLTLVASIVAIVQGRRGEPRIEGTATETRILWGVAAVLSVIAVVSAGVTIGARDTVEDEERIGAFEMVLKKTAFETETLTAKPNEAVRLIVKNEDLFMHTFTIDDLDVDVTVGPNGEKAVRIPPAGAGNYEYKCTIPGHESMTGTLTVG